MKTKTSSRQQVMAAIRPGAFAMVERALLSWDFDRASTDVVALGDGLFVDKIAGQLPEQHRARIPKLVVPNGELLSIEALTKS